MEGFVASVVNAKLGRVPRGEPARRPTRSSARRSRPPRPAPPRARRATSRAASRRWRARRCRASSPTARCKDPSLPSCSSSRATPPAARPSRAATAPRRRCSRCAARSSTSRRARIDKVLQNNEIQALITALGTGVRDEFDLEKLRYHKIILMTDADVDGAHIRTLVLTLLFREMQELIEAGYVYIAKPPLYKLTQGKQERYIEKESELEEILLGDKLETLRGHRRRRPARSSSPRTRWQRYTPAAQAVRGLGAARCAPSTATRSCTFLEESAAPRRRRSRRRRRCSSSSRATAPRREPYTTELVVADDGRDPRQGGRERKTGLARTHRLRRALFEANEYRQLSRVHARARRARRHAAVHGQARRRDRGGAVVRGRCAARCSRSPARASSCSASRASAR